MKKENGIFTIPCEINGLSLRLVFDTGASDVSISLSEAIFMIKNDYLSKSDINGSTSYQIANGDIVEGTTLTLRTVKIGNKVLRDVEASIVHSLSAPLLLGQSALNKLGTYSFNYEDSTLIFGTVNKSKSASNFDSPKKYTTSKKYVRIDDSYVSITKRKSKIYSKEDHQKEIFVIQKGTKLKVLAKGDDYWIFCPKVYHCSEPMFTTDSEAMFTTDS